MSAALSSRFRGAMWSGVTLNRKRLMFGAMTLGDLVDAARVVAPYFMVPQAYVTGERPDRPYRRPKPETEARKVCLYLANTERGASIWLLHVVTGIDRRQVARSIASVEDRRDDPFYDALLDRFAAEMGPRK